MKLSKPDVVLVLIYRPPNATAASFNDIIQRTEETIRALESPLPEVGWLSLHMTKSYVRTATRSTLKVEANLTQILNFKANFHTEFEPFLKKKFMLTMVDALRLSA